jgi:hypothetical protein
MTEFDETSAGDGFRVNFSSKEASAEGRSTQLLPRGDYHVKVTEGSIEECGPESRNPGKPYYKLECTIQSGPHAGRKLFTNAMLFEGALYTIVQIMKAMGLSVEPGEMMVPSINEIMGNDFIVGVVKKGESTGTDGRKYDEKNEINSFMPYTADRANQLATVSAGAKKSGSSSLMP